jgi:hypothetical protein
MCSLVNSVTLTLLHFVKNVCLFDLRYYVLFNRNLLQLLRCFCEIPIQCMGKEFLMYKIV